MLGSLFLVFSNVLDRFKKITAAILSVMPGKALYKHYLI